MTSDKQTVEPVAWRWRLKSDPGQSDLDWSYSSVKARAYGWIRPESWEVQPLYTAPASPSLGERSVAEVLDAASAYMKETYGIGALSHPTDRARVLALLSRPEGGDG